ncbi:MAG: hypothetical protein WCC38_00110, partial [Pseudonocardiaceae bacterium]
HPGPDRPGRCPVASRGVTTGHDRAMDLAIRHIGIFLFADVEELDAIGPWEVLSAWTQNCPDDG